MEAPEKIYITPHFERRWFTKEIDDVSVEYTRTDAFIDKACKYLEPNVKIILCGDKIDTNKFIESFKNYMKGE